VKETEGDFMDNSICFAKNHKRIYVQLGQVLCIHTTGPGAMYLHLGFVALVLGHQQLESQKS
jgi:hypothetical protein